MSTVDKLGVYNAALRLLGQRKLASISENRDARHWLDDAWDLGAPERCLEMVQPAFASTVAKLDTPSTSSVHGLDSVHTLPADYLTLIRNPKTETDKGVYTDDKLSQPVARFIIENDNGDNKLACEHATIYVRYIVSTLSVGNWDPAFVRVVCAYLANELVTTVSPGIVKVIGKRLEDAIKICIQLDVQKGSDWASPTSVDVDNDWLPIYQDALLILGLNEITSGDDRSNRRVKLDTARSAGAVRKVLEEITWTFASYMQKADYDPDEAPGWGYSRVFAKPADMHRLWGVFSDEYMTNAVSPYQEMEGKILCNTDTIYIKYVHKKWLTLVASWPSYFSSLVAARMAKDAAQSLVSEGVDTKVVHAEYSRRLFEATGRDAAQGPPRVLQPGSWVSSRGGYGSRGFGRP